MMKNKKKIFLWAVPFTVCVLILYSCGENYCHFYPSIDTRYASGFTAKRFLEIKEGISREELLELLGYPLDKISDGNEEKFYYSQDGRCRILGYKYADFAWIGYSVSLENGVVVRKNKQVYYD